MNLEEIKTAYPYPAEKPAVDQNLTGWFHDWHKRLLSKKISHKDTLIIELGSWLGLSTKYLLEKSGKATVICVDHWLGNPETLDRPIIPILYETFLVNMWPHRNRVVPLRMTTTEGIELCKELKPDVIYVDAGHSYEEAYSDIDLCCTYFPEAEIVGDDWRFKPDDEFPVRRAVQECAAKYGKEIVVDENAWMFK